MNLHPDVVEERRRQDQVWGEQEHDDPLWLAILTEEVGEAAEGVLHEIFGGPTVTRLEVVQVAAVALAWIECMDRRVAPSATGGSDE
jgi:NTP pyrophosphatase (non-canonical NTP hydrolase)